MHKRFEINQTKIKGGCQSGREVVTHKSDLPLAFIHTHKYGDFSKISDLGLLVQYFKLASFTFMSVMGHELWMQIR